MKDLKENTILALKNSSKGKLKYDREWMKEGRSKEIFKFVTQLNKIHVPKGVSLLCLADGESSFSEGTEGQGASNTKHAVLNNAVLKASGGLEKSNQNYEDEGSMVSPSSPLSVSISSDSSGNDSPEPFLETGHEGCNNLVCYEEERKKRIDKVLKDRNRKLEQYSDTYVKQLSNQMEIFLDAQQLNHNLQKTQLMKLDELQFSEMEKVELEMKNNQRHKRLGDKIKEVERRNIELEERKRKDYQANEERRKVLTHQYNTFCSLTETLNTLLLKCLATQFLEVSPDDRRRQLKNIQDSLLKILDNTTFTDTILLESQKLKQMARDFLNDVIQDIKNAEIKHENCRAQQEAIVQPTPPDIPKNEVVNETVPVKNSETMASGDCQNLPKIEQSENFFLNLHKALQLKHQLWEKDYAEFLSNSANKKYIFNLKKVINLSLNSISTAGGKINEKIDKLTSLLNSRSVSVGPTSISIRDHPAAIYFCADTIAKKFIHLAEVQVSAKESDAFPLAAVAISLWSHFPKLGELILFHLYDRCPHLRPGSIMQPKDKNDMNGFFKALGYLFEDGEPEDEELFMKRMSGIVRFYAAILITSPAPSHRRSAHPYGLQHGWRFMSVLLTTEPLEGVTATLLLDFLEICGHDLLITYNKQFKKILHILCKDYFQILKRQDTVNAALSRLEMFLHTTLVTGMIPKPLGLLDENQCYMSSRY